MTRSKEVARHATACLITGVFLFAVLAQSEYLLAPSAVEGLARLFYRGAYFFVLPFRGLVILFIPQVNHHWSTTHHFVVALGAPLFYWLVWILGRSFYGRVRGLGESEGSDGVVVKLSRRDFLVRSAGGAVGMGMGGLGTYSVFIEPQRLQVRHYSLSIRDLPGELEGLRVVHISDTHYGPFVSLSYLRGVVARANSLGGDLVLLTGDYVHRTEKSIVPGIEIFRALRSPLGSVAILGNHDHWEGAAGCRAAFKAVDIPLIDNDRLYLGEGGLRRDAPGRPALCIAGVGDLWEDDVLFDRAFRDTAPSTPRIVLSHNPDVAEMIPGNHRVDVMLSGHTHGGQVRLPLAGAPIVPSRYGQKYSGGLCRGPRCRVIVSRGVGMAGLPLRFCVEPEIGLITFRRA